MSFMALEISVNGGRLYTVGAEDWRTLRAHVLGHRMTPEFFTPEMMPPGEEVPDKDVVGINLSASVSVPGEGYTEFRISPPQQINEYTSKSFKHRSLKVGDVVTIKIIETDVADKPDAPKPDPRYPGPTAMPAESE